METLNRLAGKHRGKIRCGISSNERSVLIARRNHVVVQKNLGKNDFSVFLIDAENKKKLISTIYASPSAMAELELLVDALA